jgi:flagellar basal-body rod protein FlgC
MELLKSLKIAATGLRAQTGRMCVIAENIANVDSTARTADGEPYRRRIPTFQAAFDREAEAQVVKLGAVRTDATDFERRYEPGHPAADAAGYVRVPNVNPLIEAMDMREAQRSYEANLNVITAARHMIQKTLDLLKA